MFKILVLEDDIPSLFLMTEILEKSGYTVISATDGLEALTIAEKELPDLAIVDIMLPSLNGYQVCERLHRIPQLKSLPIIILTVLNEEQHRLRAIEAGAIDFLSKPFKRVELLTKIKSILAMQKENSEKIPFDTVCFAFFQALTLRMPELREGSSRCAQLAERLGIFMGLSPNDLLILRYGILMRDIGYLSIPTEIIDTGYTDDGHAALGSKIIEPFQKPALSTIIRYHHHTLHSPDYPKEIPDNLSALLRITIVCTRFDYLMDNCKKSFPEKTFRQVMIEETRRGLWPKEEVELLLRLTDET